MKGKQTRSTATQGFMPAVNMIGEGTTIEGEINTGADIRIDGMLKGVVTSKAKVVVGVTGNVNGNVHSDSAEIMGKVTGTIIAKDILFLKNSAKVDGDIVAGKLVIEAGAVFNGNCSMGAQAAKMEVKRPASNTNNQQKSQQRVGAAAV